MPNFDVATMEWFTVCNLEQIFASIIFNKVKYRDKQCPIGAV